MFIHPKERRQDDVNPIILNELEISGSKVKYVKKSKVLGLIMDNSLKFVEHAKRKLQQSWLTWHRLTKKTTRVKGLNSSSLLILFKTLVLTKILYASPIWLKSNINIFKDLMAKAKLKIIGAEFYPTNDEMNVMLGLPPLALMCDINTIKFVLKCLTAKDIMSGLIHQLSETPSHPYFDHIQLVKQYVVFSTHSKSIRGIDIGLIPIENFFYSKSTINEFLCHKWDGQLKAEECKLFKNDQIDIDSMSIMMKPFIRRFESRQSNVQYLDFIHGRSARFMDFRRKVGIANTTNAYCIDCGIGRDSVKHKLFECNIFNGTLRDNFVNSIGNNDYKSVILFSRDEQARQNFRILVDRICEISYYDYREVLNR